MTEPVRLPPPHPATLAEQVLLAQCEIGKGRSGGPGGQHRNKVETLVMLRHLPSDVRAKAGERRSAVENLRVATGRLRLALAVEVRCPVPLGEARSELWKQRCRDGRIVCNPDHADYAALLAEALDMLDACELDHQRAALRLACTPTQIVRLFKEHAPAFTRINALRRARGEHSLK